VAEPARTWCWRVLATTGRPVARRRHPRGWVWGRYAYGRRGVRRAGGVRRRRLAARRRRAGRARRRARP
jgi:hypothetical protein